MHDVAVALDLHELLDVYAACLRHPAHVVAAEVHQHDVLRTLLRVGEEVFLEVAVLRLCGAALAGARKRPVGDLPLLVHSAQDLWRRRYENA